MSRIYLASSWRNEYQPALVDTLRLAGHEVYDFRNPPGRTGFAWKQIEDGWQSWSIERYRQLLTTHEDCAAGFAADKAGLDWSDICVLLLPCGRSAHLEAGYAVGQGKKTIIYLKPEDFQPDLMYLFGTIVVNDDELLVALQ